MAPAIVNYLAPTGGWENRVGKAADTPRCAQSCRAGSYNASPWGVVGGFAGGWLCREGPSFLPQAPTIAAVSLAGPARHKRTRGALVAVHSPRRATAPLHPLPNPVEIR